MTDSPGFDPIAEARRHWLERSWTAAAEGMAVVTSIMRAQQILLARVDGTLRPYDLTFARYELLMLLSFSRSGKLPMSKVSSRLQVHPTSVTNAVDRLEQAGLVTRQPHLEDRRITLIAITPAGRKLGERATKALNAAVFENVGLSPTRSAELVELLFHLRDSAGDLDRPGVHKRRNAQ